MLILWKKKITKENKKQDNFNEIRKLFDKNNCIDIFIGTEY